MTSSLSKEMEKQTRGLRPQERWSSRQRRQRVRERSRHFSRAEVGSQVCRVVHKLEAEGWQVGKDWGHRSPPTSTTEHSL